MEDLKNAQQTLATIMREESNSERHGQETDVYLINGVNRPRIEAKLAEDLNDCAEVLESTPRLQDKALRCVFSVGIDCCIIDAESSVKMGRLELRQGDIVSHKLTDGVFGEFRVN
jgi:hypothetical protein